MSVLHMGEGAASLPRIEWRAVQKCQPAPRHPRCWLLLCAAAGAPCPFPSNERSAFGFFPGRENSECYSKGLLRGGLALGTEERSCSEVLRLDLPSHGVWLDHGSWLDLTDIQREFLMLSQIVAPIQWLWEVCGSTG